jgi:competence ComEA-like helix-hairpin-helix protein
MLDIPGSLRAMKFFRRCLECMASWNHIKRSSSTVLAILLLGLLFSAIAFDSPASAQQTNQRGIFGTITDVQDLGVGLTVVTVETEQGDVYEVEVLDELTIVEILGRTSTSAADLSLGDFVAAVVLSSPAAVNINTASAGILATLPQIGQVRAQAIIDHRGSRGRFRAVNGILDVPGIGLAVYKDIRLLVVVNDRVEAENIMVKSSQAKLHSHFTGVVVESSQNLVMLMDKAGNRVVSAFPNRAELPVAGDVVTTLVRHDPWLNTFTVLGFEVAQTSRSRLMQALTDARGSGASDIVETLGNRLKNITTSNLTLVHNVVDRSPRSSVHMERSLTSAETMLATLDLGEPMINILGVIDLVDPVTGVISLAPDIGSHVEMSATSSTVITEHGRSVPLHEDHLGRRAKVAYGLVSLDAVTIELIDNKILGNHLNRSLLSWALKGESEGTVTNVYPSLTPPSIVVQPPSGDPLTLRIVEGTKIDIKGAMVVPEDLKNLRVKVRYDPVLLELHEISSGNRRPGEIFTSGVVIGTVTKETRQVSVASSSGMILTLSITDNTVVEKDGLVASINHVRIWDLVRPTTLYEVGTLEVKKLALRSPIVSVSGPVVGMDTMPDASNFTIYDSSMGLVTLSVTESTEIVRFGEESELRTIELKDMLGPGSLYDAINQEAISLVVELPSLAQMAGTISELDTNTFVMVLTSTEGEAVTLLVPRKTGIVTIDDDPRSNFLDLSVGDLVHEVVYDRENQIVRYLLVASQ